jgi:hypothetical protein
MTPLDANDLAGVVPVCCLYYLRGSKHPGSWEHIFGSVTHFIDLGTCNPSSGSISTSRKKNILFLSKVFKDLLREALLWDLKKNLAFNKKCRPNNNNGVLR